VSLWLGVITFIAGAFLVLWLVQTGGETPLFLTVGMCLIFFGAAPILAIGPARALDATTNRVGFAAALVGCTELAVGGVAAAAVTVLHDDTSMPLAITLVSVSLASALVLWHVGRREKQLAASGRTVSPGLQEP